jgi:hypothetical protein
MPCVLLLGNLLPDAAELMSWGLLVALQDTRQHRDNVYHWTKDLITRMDQLGLQLQVRLLRVFVM